jgi:hypothetical protein
MLQVSMCHKRNPIEPGVLDIRVWRWIVGHGEIAIMTLNDFPAMR